MAAIIHFRTDCDCVLYIYGIPHSILKCNQFNAIELNQGRHLLVFKSLKYGDLVTKEYVQNVPSSDWEDYADINLIEKENLFSRIMAVSKEELESGVKDYQGNVYSSDWTRLFQAANNPIVHIDEKCNVICNNAFDTASQGLGLSSVVEKVELPDNLSIIGEYAFQFCVKLKKVILPERLKAIGQGAFSCSGLESIRIPEEIIKINDYTFDHNRNLKQTVLPDSLIEIGSCAFNWCDSLDRLNLPKGVKSICEGAFDNSIIVFK